MDSPISSEESVKSLRSGNGRSHVDPLDSIRIRDLLNRLTKVTAALGDDVDRLAQQFCAVVAESIGDLCSITLLNQQNEMMHLAGLYDPDPYALSLLKNVVTAATNLPRENGLAGLVIRTGQPVLRPSIPEDELRAVSLPEFIHYVDQIGIGSIMVAPLKGRGGNIGAVSVSRHKASAPYTENDLSLLVDISLLISIALENAMLINALRAEVAAASSVKAALSVSEERFRSIFQSTALGIEVMDSLGNLVDVNPAFEAMTGYSSRELVGKPSGILQHPEDAVPVLQIVTEIRMNREPAAPIENRIIRKDGSTLWVKTNFAGVKRSAGDQMISLIVALHEDMTGHKQTERYFQAVLEATPDALVMIDAQGKIVLINRQMEQMFGYQRQEVLGQPVEILVPERLRDKHPLNRAAYLLDPHVRPMGADLELFAVRQDGAEFPVEISLSPLQQTEGGLVVVAAVRDITERKEREAALVRSERSLSEAQKVAHLGSLDYDTVLQTVDASDEALRILGIPRDKFHGSDSIRAAMHPADEQRVVDATYAAVNNHTSGDFEFRVVHPDGTVRIVHDRVIGVYDEDGKPTRMIGTIQDVTEQRLAEKELSELRNHLQTSVELERLRLAQDLHDGPMQELYGSSYRLDEIIAQAGPDLQASLADVNEELQQTISELRAIAKELRPPAISNFGLEKAIRSYVEDFQEKHPKIQLHLSLAADRQLLPENMRLTLFRVFQQALTNVVRHSQASEVRVRFSLDAEEARLEITDNGTGFSVPSNWMGFVRHGHYGLAGAAERVHALGGILLVNSAPAQSTTVTAVIPWTPEEKSRTASPDA